MNQNEDLVVALMNLISLEKCVADNDVLLDMVRNIKKKLLGNSNEIDIKELEELANLLCNAENQLGNVGGCAEICKKIKNMIVCY